ncbi:hypothetical protein [Seleniivibrio woodruffii]|uniref:hypothetical protein n=1 Tax=Seleniivibrio woodruffii TaxID=1078050 RepID=UPI002409522B|nr:hypothetical protein [Seleniivibrio woodruffii]
MLFRNCLYAVKWLSKSTVASKIPTMTGRLAEMQETNAPLLSYTSSGDIETRIDLEKLMAMLCKKHMRLLMNWAEGGTAQCRKSFRKHYGAKGQNFNTAFAEAFYAFNSILKTNGFISAGADTLSADIHAEVLNALKKLNR